MTEMKRNLLSLCALLLILLSTLVAKGQEIDQLKEGEDAADWDAILNSIEDAEGEDLYNSQADELYKNLWEGTNIRYPSTIFAQKNDTLVFTLVGPNESPYCHPFKGNVISKYGPRSGRMHTGTDIKLKNGDSVYCAFDGKVRLAKAFSGYGKLVLVRHNNGLETVYSHLKAISVKVNDTIKAGDLIGLGGRTGRATTDHLHFETRIFGDPFDSNKYIDFETYTLRSQFLYYKDKKIAIDLDGLKETTPPAKQKQKQQKQPSQQLAADPNATKHVVRRGDNLWSIAKMYNTTVKTLCTLNNVTTSTVLNIGATLVVK